MSSRKCAGPALTSSVQQSRHWLIDPHTLSASAASGGWERLLIPLAIYLGVCLISVVTFRRLAPRAAEEL